MAERRDRRTAEADTLGAWALASFHAAMLLVAPLAVGHAVVPGVVGDLLGGLDTLVGAALYLVLWGSTWWSNRRYLADCPFTDIVSAIRAGAKWGAVTGLPLLCGLVAAVFLETNPTFTALVLVAGGIVAPLVGSVVGVLFAGVDVALDRTAAWIVHRRTEQ